MKLAVRTIWYSFALIGLVWSGIAAYPLVWPHEPIWFLVITLALFGAFCNVFAEILKPFVGKK